MSQGRLLIGNRRYSSWSMRGWLAVQSARLDVTIDVIPMSAGTTAAITSSTPAGLVPYLEHDGARVWESLAIGEYCAEYAPELWPEDRLARAEARSAAAEMHAGFRGLRQAMPMNLGRHDLSGLGRSAEALADIARIEALWSDLRGRFGNGGDYLFGTTFGIADIMFAPVVARLLAYRPALSAVSAAYCEAVRNHPLVDEWYGDAEAEPAEWMLPKYENLHV